jgi:hypothetical protein
MKALSLFAVIAFATLASADSLPAGTATGTCSIDAQPAVKLAFAGAFVDEKDSDHPTVIMLSDIKLPIETWTSDFDIMRFKTPFSGVAFFINKEGQNNRCDFYWMGKQTSVSGYFTLKLDAAKGKEITGSVVTDTKKAEAPHADATFHAVLK